LDHASPPATLDRLAGGGGLIAGLWVARGGFRHARDRSTGAGLRAKNRSFWGVGSSRAGALRPRLCARSRGGSVAGKPRPPVRPGLRLAETPPCNFDPLHSYSSRWSRAWRATATPAAMATTEPRAPATAIR